MLEDDQLADPTACLELMFAGFERATNTTGAPIERWYRLGEEHICLRFAGSQLMDAVHPAISHLEIPERGTDGPRDADFTVSLWDTASTGAPLSPLVERLRWSILERPYDFLSPRHEMLGINNQRVPASCDLWSGVMSLFDRETSQGVYWVPNAAAIPYFERGAPLRAMLSWWLSDHGYQSVHAAAVGFEDGGVLLTGKGGSGKSTTALSCLESPLGFAGDDYCLIRSAAEGHHQPAVFSMYNTAKLNGTEDLERQPRFRPMVENPEAGGSEKLLMYLQRHLPERVLGAFPLKAIIVPTVVGHGPTTLEPAAPGSALRALGPTTMLQLPGAATEAFQAMGSLVRTLPCYQLQLGSDIAAAPELIIGLLRGENNG